MTAIWLTAEHRLTLLRTPFRLSSRPSRWGGRRRVRRPAHQRRAARRHSRRDHQPHLERVREGGGPDAGAAAAVQLQQRLRRAPQGADPDTAGGPRPARPHRAAHQHRVEKLRSNSTPAWRGEALDIVQEAGLLDRVLFSSFNHFSLANLRDAVPAENLALLYSDGLYDPWKYAHLFGARYLHPHFYALQQPNYMWLCHEAGDRG